MMSIEKTLVGKDQAAWQSALSSPTLKKSEPPREKRGGSIERSKTRRKGAPEPIVPARKCPG
jgi:hypothetical protein